MDNQAERCANCGARQSNGKEYVQYCGCHDRHGGNPPVLCPECFSANCGVCYVCELEGVTPHGH